MAGWNSSLTQEEIDSLVTLITRWDEVELGAIPAPEVPIVTTEESILLGEALYASNCSMCHGPEGQGTRRAPALNVKGFLTQTPDQAIQQIIMQGVPGTAMPAWGDRMLESDIQAIVGFIRQWEATAPEVATPATMGRGGRGGGGGPPWANDSNWTPPGMSGSGEISQEELDALRAAEAAGGGHEEGAGGPPEGAGPPEGFGEEAGGHGGEETGMYGGAEGGVPPWAQEMEEPAWWETLDVRVWTLILGALALALLLIVIGYTALRRSPPPDNRS
jgi:mono/diheme cytochrome c family protein